MENDNGVEAMAIGKMMEVGRRASLSFWAVADRRG
jgi:hypothetical protein